jgi:hypothetical protein
MWTKRWGRSSKWASSRASRACPCPKLRLLSKPSSRQGRSTGRICKRITSTCTPLTAPCGSEGIWRESRRRKALAKRVRRARLTRFLLLLRHIAKILDYLLEFSRFKNREITEQADHLLQTRTQLHVVERSQLGTSTPTTC